MPKDRVESARYLLAAAGGVAPRTEPTSSSSSNRDARAAAAAEAARREAARRAAAEAARRAAEAARERARRAAEAARERAREAQAARQRAQRAEEALRNRQRMARTEGPEAMRGLDSERRRVATLRDRATTADTRAREARDLALREGDAAIRAEKDANTAASAAGLRRPYGIADRVDNIQDAGSVNREDQQRLLGTRSVVTPQEAARYDADRVRLATERGPDQGARELERQLEANRDPAYQRSLIDQSRPSIERIGQQLVEGVGADDETQRRTLRSLANAAEVAGPERGRTIADHFSTHLPENLQNEDCGRLAQNLAEVSKDERGARFGANIADRLTETGRYSGAETISNASPELRRLTSIDAGEREAMDRIRVNSEDVTTERTTLERDRATIDRETREQVDDVFTRAGRDDLPEGVEARVEGDRAEIIRRDEKGRVLEREIAIREGDEVSYQQTTWRRGVAHRKTQETGGEDGTVVRHERWNETANDDPANPTTEQLSNALTANEKGIQIAEQRVKTEAGATTSTETLINEEGRRSTTQTYRTQTGGDGIHGVPEEDFDTDRTIEVIETERTVEPRDGEAETTREWSYSQGNVRATAIDDEDEDTPKQWTLEKQDGNTYRSQTFLENAPDFTTLTTRRATGRTVTEEVESRGKNEDDEDITTRATSTTTFGRDGRIDYKHANLVDEEGIETDQTYRRTYQRGPNGLSVSEDFHTRRTEPGEPPKIYEADKQIRSTERDGQTFVHSVEERIRAQNPDGTWDDATSRIDRNGQHLTVNGKPIPLSEGSIELDRLSEEERELAATVAAGNIKQVSDLVDQGKNLTDLTRVGAQGVDNPYYNTRLSRDTQDLLNYRLTQLKRRVDGRFGAARVDRALEVHTRAAAGARGALGVAGVVTSGLSFFADVQNFNASKLPKAALDAGGVAVGASGTVAAAREIRALRAGATPEGVSSAAGRFGQFAKFGGLAVGVGTNGYDLYEGIRGGDKVKIAKGGVGVVGTVGAFAAGSAVGGPPGVAVGVAVGLLTFGVQWAIGHFFGDDEPKVAKKEI